jgi:signal peptidase II
MKHLVERKKYIILVFGIFFLNYLSDRLTKIIAIKYLKESDPIKLLNDIIILTFTENTGAFLSLGAKWNIYIKYFVLLIVPIIICIIILIYLMTKEAKMHRIIIGSCIIGGGIGNLFDRLFNNFKVIDFMNYGIGNIRTGILNVADLSVTFGVIILMLFEILVKEKKNKYIKRAKLRITGLFTLRRQ